MVWFTSNPLSPKNSPLSILAGSSVTAQDDEPGASPPHRIVTLTRTSQERGSGGGSAASVSPRSTDSTTPS